MNDSLNVDGGLISADRRAGTYQFDPNPAGMFEERGDRPFLNRVERYDSFIFMKIVVLQAQFEIIYDALYCPAVLFPYSKQPRLSPFQFLPFLLTGIDDNVETGRRPGI